MNKLANPNAAPLPEDFPVGKWTKDRVAQLMGGTVAVGGGLALLSILNDQIRSNRRKTRADSGQVLDDTITISPLSKGATTTEWMMGLGAGAGSYMLLQKVYQVLREKQLKKEIEEEESGYTSAIQDSIAPQLKQANSWERALEILASVPQDVLWGSGLAAAAGTYGLLEHTWPRVGDKPEAGKPKKIVVKGFGTVMADGPGDGPVAQMDKERGSRMAKEVTQSDARPVLEGKPAWLGGFSKAAAISWPVGKDDAECAAAMMTFLLAEQPAIKLACSGLVSLIGAHHQAPEKTEELVKQSGLITAVELSKGAERQYYDLPVLGKQAAVWQAMKSPVLGPGLLTLAIAELEEFNPDLSKRARVINADPYYGTIMTKIAALTWQAEVVLADGQDGLVKSAAAASMAGEMRRQMGTLGLSESTDAGGEMDDADDAYTDESDPIDEFLAGKKKDKKKSE